MTNKRKMRTAKLAAKLGVSYQAADNQLKRGRRNDASPTVPLFEDENRGNHREDLGYFGDKFEIEEFATKKEAMNAALQFARESSRDGYEVNILEEAGLVSVWVKRAVVSTESDFAEDEKRFTFPVGDEDANDSPFNSEGHTMGVESLSSGYESIKDLQRMPGGYRFKLGALSTPITVRMRVNKAGGIVEFEQSHFIHTPLQATPYQTSTSWGHTEEEALRRALRTLVHEYDAAIRTGHSPAESWLVVNLG